MPPMQKVDLIASLKSFIVEGESDFYITYIFGKIFEDFFLKNQNSINIFKIGTKEKEY